MTRVKEIIKIDGIEVKICDSMHSIERFFERFDGDETAEYDILECLEAMGPFILDLKNGQEFAIIHRAKNLMIVGGLNTCGIEVFFDLLTVVETNKFFIKKGTDTVVFDMDRLVEYQTA